MTPRSWDTAVSERNPQNTQFLWPGVHRWVKWPRILPTPQHGHPACPPETPEAQAGLHKMKEALPGRMWAGTEGRGEGNRADCALGKGKADWGCT